VYSKRALWWKKQMFKRKQNVADLTIAEGKTVLEDTN
jgi:hypothetical protein